MESIPYHPLLQVTPEEIIAVRKFYDLDAKKINENLDIIEEWCKKEEHLVEALPNLSRDILERFHIIGRGSIERTKKIIDKVLTVSGMVPEILTKAILSEYEALLENILVTPLPKANPKDNTRILLIYINENFEDINILDFAKMGCYIVEMMMHYDYIFSQRMIFDFKNLRASVLTKINPVFLKKVEIMFTDVYKIQIKGLHVINAPSFMNKLLYLFTQVIKEKLASRIYIHSSIDELYQDISKEVLLKEYGGEQMGRSDLIEIWKDYLTSKEARDNLEISRKLVSNESRRSCLKYNEEYLGIPGSFKRLNVD